jgi:hypothetical protein
MDSDDIAYPDRDVADARAYLLAADLYRRFALYPEFEAERAAQLFDQGRRGAGVQRGTERARLADG